MVQLKRTILTHILEVPGGRAEKSPRNFPQQTLHTSGDYSNIDLPYQKILHIVQCYVYEWIYVQEKPMYDVCIYSK